MSTADLLDGLLDRLAEVRRECPDLRFGQLIAIIGTLAEDNTGHSLWDVEDADFVAGLDRFAADLARRRSSATDRDAAPDRGGITSTPGPAASVPPRQVT